MNITINGNVTVNGNLTINEAKTLAEQGELTLRQLRSVLPSTKDAKTPSRDWVREHMDGEEVFCSKAYEDGWLTVFTNGFFYFNDGCWDTVLRVDGFKDLYYETDEFGGYGKLPEKEYIDSPIFYPLGECAMWQLKRNAGKRKSSTNESAIDSEIMESNADESTPDILDGIIEREERAEEHERLRTAIKNLTPAQKETVILRYWKKMTVKQIAAYLGRSEDTVKDRLNGAIKALKKKM